MIRFIRHIKFGIENLVDEERIRIKGRRIGLLAGSASVDHNFVHTLRLLLGAGAKVEMLFGPEHGFTGETQDLVPITGALSHPSGIPLKSLYGGTAESLAPTPEDLNGLDALVVDLQDVGARYYTFVWTALLALRACSRAGIEMILTDRPNPIDGKMVEGAPQEEGYLSFVGLKKIANRHGMTPGEIVTMAAREEGLEDHLTLIKLSEWYRFMRYDETDIPWVMPSPNMPTEETANVYPGMCLIEGTEFSEGRGTTRPFELVGGPGIDGERLAKRLTEYELPAVMFRPVTFKPEFQKHCGTVCGGVQLHVFARRSFLAYRTGVAVLLALKAETGDRFAWRRAPYEFVADIPAIDLLTGSCVVRNMVDENASLDDIARTWADGEKAFIEHRKAFLLYP